jgi:hypothetical protein
MARARLRRALVAVPIALTLSACASPEVQTTTSESQASSPASTPGSASAPASASSETGVSEPVSGSELGEHVHNLTFDGSTLLLGTHEGLWSQSPGQVPVQISQRSFDVMGFAKTESRWLASGHPARGEDGPADLGLLESLDGGVTWQEVSLSGEADFHRLTTSGNRIYGVSSVDDALLRSDDAGATWTNLGSLGLFDIALDPANPDTLIATTADGLVRSTDAGATFSPVATPSLIALLAWTPNYVVGADVDGRILTSVNGGSTWEALTTLPEQPAALGADGSRIAVLAGPTVFESIDGGKTFTERITEIPGH